MLECDWSTAGVLLLEHLHFTLLAITLNTHLSLFASCNGSLSCAGGGTVSVPV